MKFLSISELRQRAGLRVILVAGAPSPWGQAAKAMMEYKKLDFAAGLRAHRDAFFQRYFKSPMEFL